jgi:hypothetical protein
MNNGDTVNGTKMKTVQTSFSYTVELDGQKFRHTDIKGYRHLQVYYINNGKKFPKRILRGGKINLYMNEVNDLSPNGMSVFYEYFARRGEGGVLIPLKNALEIKKVVEDCSVASKMVDMSNNELIKKMIADNYYLYSIFKIYNNDCKE